ARQLRDGLADQLLILAQLETHSPKNLGHGTPSRTFIVGTQPNAPVRSGILRTGALSPSGPVQSLLPVSSLAAAAKSAKFAPVFSFLERAWMETSWSPAALRSAPTVACSLLMWVNGSQWYQRHAFSKVILLISSSGTLCSLSTSSSCSGAPGHIESLCG